MLIKVAHLHQIKSGTLNILFRTWNKPRVNSGSLIHTAVGQMSIDSVVELSPEQITEQDVLDSVHESKDDLLKNLRLSENKKIFKISISYGGADPRIAMREQTDMSQVEIDRLLSRLKGLDQRSAHGKWTGSTIKIIKDQPKQNAASLAAELGFEKQWFKVQVRKLKNMGLTISHEVGYSLSPLGLRIFEEIKEH